MLKRTPLYDEHIKKNAKMVDFGGWEMPVQYTSILTEHTAVREYAGIFDASHMGQIRVRGAGAKEALNKLLTNDLFAVKENKAMYTCMLNEKGGVLDDLLVYALKCGDLICVVNASNVKKDFEWIYEHINGGGVTVADESDNCALIAVQGPLAEEITQKHTDYDLKSLTFFSFAPCEVSGKNAIISRTGYTGEDGFEIYINPADAAFIWNNLLSDKRAVPAGLGARDTLRLEAGLPLYGHELTEGINPHEAGLNRFVKMGKGDFFGRDALVSPTSYRRLTGIELTERGVPREGCRVMFDGSDVGYITSGTHSPTLKKGIAMALISGDAGIGDELGVVIRDKVYAAKAVKLPFYKR
jgi:aminomethyltransferase